MTQRDKDTDGAQRDLLGAALLGQTGTPKGAPPSVEELKDWARHRLSGDRREEVLTHLAFEPHVYKRAMEIRRLLTAERKKKPEKTHPTHLRRWFDLRSFGPVAAGIAVIGVAGVAALLLLRETPLTLGPDAPPVLRNQSNPHPDWRVAAFRAGYHHQPGAAVLDRAAVSVDGCLDGADCPRLAASLNTFGGLVARIDRLCEPGGFDAARRASLAGQLRQIEKDVATSLELSGWRPHLATLSQALDTGADEACAQSQAIGARLLND